MSEYTTVKYCSKCDKRQSFLCSGSGRIQICEECGTEYDEVELPDTRCPDRGDLCIAEDA